MKFEKFICNPRQFTLTNGLKRSIAIISLVDKKGNISKGEIAPLPPWSKETLEEAIRQIDAKKSFILNIDWTIENYRDALMHLHLFPSVQFGIESALLSFLDPLKTYSMPVSALLMGSKKEILAQAKLRLQEGYQIAKLKVSQLSFSDAAKLIHQLKDTFRLRIDVNRAWKTEDSLQFFSEYSLDSFDYVEEPFQNPKELSLFSHPLAVDESFPSNFSLQDLETLCSLKSLIYKPTLQGGMTTCLPVYKWAKQRNIEFVLSSSFESELGLFHLISMAARLKLTSPIGIGTYHFLPQTEGPFLISNGQVNLKNL
ncbi:o-succinylbenzoate synthase [Candidatus Protochlamydia sp. R18]|uniref:o-succinylbenzoate synthase n=1 Tax=Candidatus Protochlamydia sp. R18 TaxID=1353977 RepID=UPI0005A66B95|nr:o-succinylbenzoate synthase [Candidatus Protochlamydia sp. R18]